MTQWGMVVDLGRCVGCHTCTIACKMENGLPPSTLWRTVVDTETGTFPEVSRTFVPMTCMHCADPPCYPACPTTATKVREDGIVWIDNALCIGCGSCVVACPYRARHLVPDEQYYFGAATPPERETYDRERVGICTKCHFCFHKFDEAPADVTPGEHPDYTPACSSSCIANAIVFGDLADPGSNVSRLIAERGPGERMLEALGTQPSVVYLNAPPIEPQAPLLQHSWHRLAVANFFCGTTGVGLYLWAVLTGWFGHAAAPLLDAGDVSASLAAFSPGGMTALQVAGLLAPLLVLVGLLSVGAEAGRPLRGFNVFRHVHGSWMSRESAFAFLFVGLTLLDTVFLQQPLVQAVAVLAGLGIMLAQGLILANAKGIPAWSVPIMPLHFVTAGLASGMGAWLMLLGIWQGGGLTLGLILAALGALAVNLAVWWRYLNTSPRTETLRRSLAVLRQRRNRWWSVSVGHVTPGLLLVVAGVAGDMRTVLAVLAGLAILVGGAATKDVLITKAAFVVDLFEGFGGKTQPRRGDVAEGGAAEAQAA